MEYFVNPLGGANVGGALMQGLSLGSQLEDAALRRKQSEFNLGQAQRQEQMSLENIGKLELRDNTVRFLQRLQATPPEQRQALAAQAIDDPNLDFDEEDLPLIGNDQYIGAVLQQLGGAQVSDGKPKQVIGSIQELNEYQRLLKEDPELAKQYGMKTGFVESGREEALTPQQRNFKQYQELKAQGKEGEAREFGISAGIVSKEGRELSAQAQTALQKTIEDAEANAVNVTKYIDLADRFANSEITGGLFGKGGSWSEGLKGALGLQDEDVSKIVSDWQKIRSGEAINSLPPGPATDADIRIALKPLPENANKEYMDMYLRGLAKMAEYKQRYNQAKADFISEHGSFRDKEGKNFGSYWNGVRQGVMDDIKRDPRFKASSTQRKQQFLGEAQPRKATTIGRFEIVEEGE